MRPRQVVLAVVTLIAVARPDRAPEARSRPAGAHGQERAAPAGPTHHIYITAVGKDGVPVKDLTPADIKVREDGTVKPVVAVQGHDGAGDTRSPGRRHGSRPPLHP